MARFQCLGKSCLMNTPTKTVANRSKKSHAWIDCRSGSGEPSQIHPTLPKNASTRSVPTASRVLRPMVKRGLGRAS